MSVNTHHGKPCFTLQVTQCVNLYQDATCELTVAQNGAVMQPRFVLSGLYARSNLPGKPLRTAAPEMESTHGERL